MTKITSDAEEQYYKEQDDKEKTLREKLWEAQEKIPKQYQTKKARFIKIDMTDPENRKWKKPLETDWQNTRNYPYNDPNFLKYLATGDNYGIALGYDDIGVLDADHILIDQAARKNLPDSMRVKTGSYYYGKPEFGRKTHFVFRVPGWTQGTVVLDQDPGGNHFGEFRWKGAMVVAPGSKHYDTGNTYEIENNVPIATITPEQLLEVITPYMKEHNTNKKVEKENKDKKCDLDITKILNPDDFKGQSKTEEENGIYRGKHPGHDSSTNRNFLFDINKNLWFCYQHETGGGPLELIGIKHGIIKCKDCYSTEEKPVFTKEQFKEVVRIAKEYGIELPRKQPDVTVTSGLITIPDLPKILKKEDYYKEDEKGTPRLKAPLLAEAICFNDNHNRGIFVTDDNKKIYWFNGKYWQDNGEEVVKNVIQKILGDSTCQKHKNEIIGWMKDCLDLQVTREQLDMDKHRIGLLNGVYDMKTNQLLPFDKEYLITTIFPINYNKIARCPNFYKFIQEILEKQDIKVIQEMFGYCFLKDYPLAVIFFLVGIGRNGKSTLLNVLTRMLSKENTSAVPIQSLCDDNFSGIDLYHKYANMVSDLTTKELDHTGKLKQLTGNDWIRARDLYEKSMKFKNFAKLINAMNEIPICHDNTLAWMQRCACIEFPNQFLDGAEGTDKNIIDKITTQEEIDGIFQWSMWGYRRTQKNGAFSPHKNLNDMLKFMAQTKNAILQFVRERVIYKEKNEILKDKVYEKFLKYCKDKQFVTVSSNHFSSKFKQYMMEQGISFGEGQSRILKGRVWKNIEITDTEISKDKETQKREAAGLDQFTDDMRPDEISEMIDHE